MFISTNKNGLGKDGTVMKLKEVNMMKEELKKIANAYLIDNYERFDFVAEKAKDMEIFSRGVI